MKHLLFFTIIHFLCSTITATTLIVAPTGQKYSSINAAVNAMQPGDTVLVRAGKYNGGVYLQKQGQPGALLTIKNYPGELPELNGWNGETPNSGAAFTNGSTTPASYLRIEGFYVTGYKFGMTSLNWTTFPTEEYKTGLTGKEIEIRYNVVDLCGVNGISVFFSENVTVENNLVSRTGWQQTSWSSGINMLGNGGTVIIRNNVSFHHIDISDHHTDGNGFIIDQSFAKLTIALIENNLAFLNGGSGFGTNQSSHASYIGNTSYNNGQDDNFAGNGAGGITFSNLESRETLGFRNNLCIQTNRGEPAVVYGAKLTSLQGTVGNNYLSKNLSDENIFVDAANCDFRPRPDAATVIRAGSGADIYPTDNGFDFKAIKKESNDRISFYKFAPDIDYIRSKGGLTGCFSSINRNSPPSIGAFESTILTISKKHRNAFSNNAKKSYTVINLNHNQTSGAFVINPQTITMPLDLLGRPRPNSIQLLHNNYFLW